VRRDPLTEGSSGETRSFTIVVNALWLANRRNPVWSGERWVHFDTGGCSTRCNHWTHRHRAVVSLRSLSMFTRNEECGLAAPNRHIHQPPRGVVPTMTAAPSAVPDGVTLEQQRLCVASQLHGPEAPAVAQPAETRRSGSHRSGRMHCRRFSLGRGSKTTGAMRPP
jgi:hypothetical protein